MTEFLKGYVTIRKQRCGLGYPPLTDLNNRNEGTSQRYKIPFVKRCHSLKPGLALSVLIP